VVELIRVGPCAMLAEAVYEDWLLRKRAINPFPHASDVVV
jgi:hypothetical protein